MSEWMQMVEDCEARESRLSDWEREFIASISEQLGKGRTLTPKQAETLERVWDEATKRG